MRCSATKRSYLCLLARMHNSRPNIIATHIGDYYSPNKRVSPWTSSRANVPERMPEFFFFLSHFTETSSVHARRTAVAKTARIAGLLYSNLYFFNEALSEFNDVRCTTSYYSLSDKRRGIFISPIATSFVFSVFSFYDDGKSRAVYFRILRITPEIFHFPCAIFLVSA